MALSGMTYPIRKLRDKLKLTTEQLAGMCGISITTTHRCMRHGQLPRNRFSAEKMRLALGIKE